MTNTASLSIANRTVLAGISPAAFQHPLDLKATETLQKNKGFDKFVAKFLEFGFERTERVINMASCVRIGPRQLPKLYSMLQESCSILDMPEPELYVAQGGVNAYTFGHNHPYIMLYTGLLDSMNDDEIMAVIAHELGHIKCNHVLYSSMGMFAQILVELAGDITFGIGSILGRGLDIALLLWSRRSELSADRASLLVMQNIQPCISMLMKLAGGASRFAEEYELNLEEFLNQIQTYQLDENVGDRFYNILASMQKTTHPWAVERAKEINEWIDSSEFDQILLGNYQKQLPQGQGKYCHNCGQLANPGYKFCAYCGQEIISA